MNVKVANLKVIESRSFSGLLPCVSVSHPKLNDKHVKWRIWIEYDWQGYFVEGTIILA